MRENYLVPLFILIFALFAGKAPYETVASPLSAPYKLCNSDECNLYSADIDDVEPFPSIPVPANTDTNTGEDNGMSALKTKKSRVSKVISKGKSNSGGSSGENNIHRNNEYAFNEDNSSGDILKVPKISKKASFPLNFKPLSIVSLSQFSSSMKVPLKNMLQVATYTYAGLLLIRATDKILSSKMVSEWMQKIGIGSNNTQDSLSDEEAIPTLGQVKAEQEEIWNAILRLHNAQEDISVSIMRNTKSIEDVIKGQLPALEESIETSKIEMKERLDEKLNGLYELMVG